MKDSVNDKNNKISLDYSSQLDEIRQQVKNGHCDTLRECLLLFEELWDESPKYETVLSHKFQKEMEKLSQKDPEQFEHALKKMEQIQGKPQHYKPLSGDLHGARRAHVGDFVLIYELNDDILVFHDYDHHDRVYKKELE